MGCTVHEAARLTGISEHTLRYYDRQGVMPFLERDAAGNRVFTDADFQWLQVVRCMKLSGFTLAEMRDYAGLVRRGDETLAERLRVFEEHRERALEALEQLRAGLDGLEYKCWYYRVALEAGTEDVHDDGDGVNLARCYSRFKEWEKTQLGHASAIHGIFSDEAPHPEAAPVDDREAAR